MIIFTHRGLDPVIPNFFAESSFETFQNHLNREFGIEFDVNFTKDEKIVIFHDASLERISEGTDKRLLKDVEAKEIKDIRLKRQERICFLGELLETIRKSKPCLNALHLKGRFQEKKYLDILINCFKKHQNCLKKVLIFDVRPETAEYLKGKNSELILAPSVAHEYDIERYNSYVKGTLTLFNETLKYKYLYDWVWLDEWDLNNRNGKEKKFYTKENFQTLKRAGFKISLVTPELHASSPGLLGREAHQDAITSKRLFERIKEIIKLQPEAICTDYPDKVKYLLNKY